MKKRITSKLVRRWLPRRSPEAHKGDCGRIYILGGSRGMVGASILACWGAVKGGAGLVRLGTVRSQQVVAAKRGPLEATTDPLPENFQGHLSHAQLPVIRRSIQKFNPDVVAIGPGLGVSKNTRMLVKGLLKSIRRPVVVDADALNVWAAERAPFQFSGPAIITPHPGELARLLGTSTALVQRDRERMARLAARRFRCVCVLKGRGTIVTNGPDLYVNPTGNSRMASGGMGDILTGLIAAVWGQHKEPHWETALRAACVGVYIHGLAGDITAKRNGLSVLASDVALSIPRAISRLHRP